MKEAVLAHQWLAIRGECCLKSVEPRLHQSAVGIPLIPDPFEPARLTRRESIEAQNCLRSTVAQPPPHEAPTLPRHGDVEHYVAALKMHIHCMGVMVHDDHGETDRLAWRGKFGSFEPDGDLAHMGPYCAGMT